jgi:hypothetical protein
MPDVAERYRQESGVRLIEINLKTVQQLFNSFDPSPFHEKDLDADAEEYIVGAVREFHIGTPLKLVFHLPEAEMKVARVTDLARSIHGYFGYRAEAARRDLRFLLRQGRFTLAIGLSFLALCLAIRALFLHESTATVDLIAAEGLVIIGWVAMWRPAEIFLYEWWPLRVQARVFDKLATMPVDVRPVSA